ncbi:LapA family protein [Streptomyces celluloflavus]|uniref:LapA family protein n=1 Tax=Streptomyces celluloflavus TaxID=58344 RepID=UPI0036DC7D29
MAITSRAVGLVVLAVAGVWFIAGNTQSVRIRLWVPTVWAPLWLVLAITAVVALAFGWLLHRRRSR